MKKYMLTIALLFALTSLVGAQGFGSTGSDYMNTGSTLSSTIYAVGATNVDPATTDAPAPNRGRTLGGVGDMGDQSTESPIGSPLVLLAFAALAAGWVYLRRRRPAR